MRGVRGGVERLTCDISGDSVHMVSNAAKTLLNTVDDSVQLFCSDLYYDIEESPKVMHIFLEVQVLMNISTAKHLIRPISSRFLQMKDVTTRVITLLDFLTVYYYSFLSEEEKTQYSTLRMLSVVDRDFVGHQQTETSMARLAVKIPVFSGDHHQMQLGKLAEEASRYNVDEDVKLLAANYDGKEPIDIGFSGKVFQLESFNRPRYQALKTLVSALLTSFSGPLVESSFNIMDDIVEKDRACLSVENYEKQVSESKMSKAQT